MIHQIATKRNLGLSTRIDLMSNYRRSLECEPQDADGLLDIFVWCMLGTALIVPFAGFLPLATVLGTGLFWGFVNQKAP